MPYTRRQEEYGCWYRKAETRIAQTVRPALRFAEQIETQSWGFVQPRRHKSIGHRKFWFSKTPWEPAVPHVSIGANSDSEVIHET